MTPSASGEASDLSWEEVESLVRRLAQESGKVIRSYFRKPLSVEQKEDASPVTQADKEAEERMREMIMEAFPDHGILGEEFGWHNEHASYKWVLDPIDGTRNFIAGGLMFGTLIALLRGERPILGVIHQPILGELVVGSGHQTTFNGKPVRARACTAISDAVLLTTDPYLIKEHQDFERFEALRKQVRVYRGWGDCYGYLLLACGCVDIMLDPIMHPWDSLALIPIVTGAGGTITDFRGDDPVHGTSIVATGGTIHQQVLDLLNPRTA